MPTLVTSVTKLVTGAGSATLATAVSNLNTALATAVTTAQAVTGVTASNVKTSEAHLIFDGILYIGYASVMYQVVTP